MDPGDRRRRRRGARPARARRSPTSGPAPSSARRCSGSRCASLVVGRARDVARLDHRGRRPRSSQPAQPAAGERRRRRDHAPRERGPARHRPRALHRRPGRPDQPRAARPPRAGAARPRAGHPARRRARRTTCRAWSACSPPPTCPASTTPGSSTTSRCSPTRSCTSATRSAGCSARRLEAARRGAAAVEVDYEPLPALLTVEEAIAAESFQGARPTMARGDAAAGLARAAHVFEGVTAMAGQEHFYLETHCSLAHGRRGRPGVRAVQHPAPDRDPGDRRARARRAQPRGDRAVPADGRRLRRQGDAAARARGGRRARRHPDRAPGAAAADPAAGHDDDRQAARLPRHVAGRLRRRRAVHRRSRRR